MKKLKTISNQKNTNTVMTTRQTLHPFKSFGNYIPFSKAQFQLFDSIREAVPIVDAAIEKIIRLIGNFNVECDDSYAKAELEEFLKFMPTGNLSYGIESFISKYLDSLLMYGTAIAEMVIGSKSQSLYGVYTADIRDVRIKTTDNPFCVEIFPPDNNEPIPFPERILISSLNPTSNSPLGRSLLEGLPFVTSILLKIFQSIGNNWERVGNLRYSVTYHPTDDTLLSSDKAEEIAREWSAAMSDNSQIRDFVTVGDVDIKVIGADNAIIDSKVPVQQMLEQIVAKTGIPPFILGLSWSTTERMSVQQVDILTSELEHYRKIITPIVTKICREFLRREGFFGSFNIRWENISLQDDVELAKARLYNAQAAQIEKLLGGNN